MGDWWRKLKHFNPQLNSKPLIRAWEADAWAVRPLKSSSKTPWSQCTSLSAGCGLKAPFTCGHFPGFQTKSLIGFPPPYGFLSLLWPVPNLTLLLGADACSLLAQACPGGRECKSQKHLLLKGELDQCSSAQVRLCLSCWWLLGVWKKNLAPAF